MGKASFLGGGWVSLPLLLATWAYSSHAHAEYAAPVFVRVSAGQQAFTVSAPRLRHAPPAPPLVACPAACGFWAYPGNYEVRVHGAARPVKATLRVRGPGNYDFVPEDSGPHTAGLVLGIAGPVIIGVGTVMLLMGAYDSCAADETRRCSTPPISDYGAATFVAGAAITAVGWVLYAQNRAHFTLSEARPWQPTTARLGLIPMPRGGLGFGATVTF